MVDSAIAASPSLLEKDKWGNWVISTQHNAAMLAEALCKLEGFVHAPNDTIYWQHGHSTERDFIYVTTQKLRPDQLRELSDEVGSDRTLLVRINRGEVLARPPRDLNTPFRNHRSHRPQS